MNISINFWFLLSLWWRELFLLGACVGLLVFGTTRLILEGLNPRQRMWTDTEHPGVSRTRSSTRECKTPRRENYA